MGAVGIDKIVSFLNNNIVVQDKATGARLSVVSIDTFWSSLAGVSSVFDPRIQFDPHNNRWMSSRGFESSDRKLIGSFWCLQTSDPQEHTTCTEPLSLRSGSAACNAQGEFADFTMLGFNKIGSSAGTSSP